MSTPDEKFSLSHKLPPCDHDQCPPTHCTAQPQPEPSATQLYATRDIESLGELYIRHLYAMTSESLYSKADIAAELAWRDHLLQQAKSELAKLREELGKSIDRELIQAGQIANHEAELARLKAGTGQAEELAKELVAIADTRAQVDFKQALRDAASLLRSQQAEVVRLGADAARYKIGHGRYEYVRRLNPRQYAELWPKAGFDANVDAAMRSAGAEGTSRG